MPPKPKTGTAEVLKKIKKCQNLKHVSNTLKFNSFSTKLTPKMRNKSSNDQIESFPLTKVQLTRKQNSAPNLLSCYPEALSSSTLTKFQSTSKASTINTRSTKRTKTDSGCSSDHDDRDDLSKPLRLKMDKHEKLEKLKLESKLPLSPLLRTEPRKLNTDPKSKEITDKEKRIERKGDKNDIPFQEFHKMNPHGRVVLKVIIIFPCACINVGIKKFFSRIQTL